ncbi:hypothetical protein [Paraburkholderia youngii]|uniref:hypothetical protein n=1 Tax=Paraburkholderia youngii TaxID=2782701 RepID=UPI003D2334C9
MKTQEALQHKSAARIPPGWHARHVPPHPETTLELVCSYAGGRYGRTRMEAYDGDQLVHSALYDYARWEGHAGGQLLMADFVAAAEKALAASQSGNPGATSTPQGLVSQITAATARFGVTVEETPSGFIHFRAPSEMCLMLHVTAGELKSERFLLNWYVAIDSAKELDQSKLRWSVNPHHRAKATGAAHGVNELLEQIEAGFACAHTGEAFVLPAPEKRRVSEKINGMDVVRVNGRRYEWNETFSGYWTVGGEPQMLYHSDLAGAAVGQGQV